MLLLSVDLYVIVCNIFYFLFCNFIFIFYVTIAITELQLLKQATKDLKLSSKPKHWLAKTKISKGATKYMELQVLHTYFNGIFGFTPFAYVLLVMLANHSITLYGALKLYDAFPLISAIAIMQWSLVSFPLVELVCLLQLGKVFELSKGLLRGWRGKALRNDELGKKLAALRVLNFKCRVKFTKVTGLRFILVVSNVTKNVILAF